MKYQLTKTVPLWNHSNILQLIGDDIFIKAVNEKFEGVFVCMGNIKDLLSAGWIEEVKPREWWVYPLTYGDGLRYEAVSNFEKCRNMVGVIKVREVIE